MLTTMITATKGGGEDKDANVVTAMTMRTTSAIDEYAGGEQ